jgi:hypothetical protein
MPFATTFAATKRGSAGLLIAALASVLVGGCGMSSLTSGLGSSLFGGSSTAAATGDNLSAEQLLTAAKADPSSAVAATGAVDAQPGCPKVVTSTRDNNITIYEPGKVGDGMAVMHRGEITKTARECVIEGSKVTVKYGFSGRVLLGPKGQGGAIAMPVNVAVIDSKRAKVANDKLTVDTTVAIENPIGYFSAVRIITYEVPEGARAGEFEVNLSFERTTPNAG